MRFVLPSESAAEPWLASTPQTFRREAQRPIARAHTVALAGDDPVIMLTAPIEATAKALKKSRFRIDDIGPPR